MAKTDIGINMIWSVYNDSISPFSLYMPLLNS